MYKIIESFNENTKLAVNESKAVYVLKRISLEDVPVMKKLIGISNPHIVKFYEFCRSGNDFYVVEEYIQGVTLEEYIMQRGALDEITVSNIASSVCVALESVHSLGIVHRDINPSNIMIDKSGVVKVIDFGISRSVSPGKRLDTHILGTQGYAAPEQYGFSQTSERADIYSLGVMINYMLTLKMPNERLADGYFGPIIQKCTEIDENKRYKSAGELLGDIGSRRKRANIAGSIPGFRADTPKSKRTGAVIFYSLFAFFELSVIIMDKIVKAKVFDALALLFMFLIPFLLGNDFLNYLERLPLTRYGSKKEKRSFKTLLIVVSVIIGCVFIVLSPVK